MCARPQHIAHDGRVAAASAISVLFAAIAGSLWWASDDAADLRRGRFAPQGFIEPQAAGRMYLDSTAHEDLLSAGFFHARTLADGEQSLRIYTRLEPDSLLGIRASGTVGATAAEVISVLREVDLIPEWNRFCDFGILLRVLRQNVLWASAGVRLPWPVPPQSLLVRAKVEADATRPGAILAVAQSVDAKSRRRLAQGVAMPSPLSSRLELPVEMAVGRLTAAGDALTRFEVALSFNLTAAAGVAVPRAPSWVINLIVWVVAPSIWSRYTGALSALRTGGSALGRRLRTDSTGLYKFVGRSSGQQPAAAQEDPSPHKQARGRSRRGWRFWQRGTDGTA